MPARAGIQPGAGFFLVDSSSGACRSFDNRARRSDPVQGKLRAIRTASDPVCKSCRQKGWRSFPATERTQFMFPAFATARQTRKSPLAFHKNKKSFCQSVLFRRSGKERGGCELCPSHPPNGAFHASKWKRKRFCVCVSGEPRLRIQRMTSAFSTTIRPAAQAGQSHHFPPAALTS